MLEKLQYEEVDRRIFDDFNERLKTLNNLAFISESSDCYIIVCFEECDVIDLSAVLNAFAETLQAFV